MTTESIIIYRNPMEAAFWDIVMNSPYTFPVVVALVAFMFGAWLFNEHLSRYIPSRRRWEYEGYVAIAFGAVCAVATFWLMV